MYNGYRSSNKEVLSGMDRSQGMHIVEEFIKNQGLINHMLCVEAAMRWYAEKLDQDVESWGLTGLLHDFDWEIHPTLEEHPFAGAPILRERGVPEEIVSAVLSHANHTGYPRDTLMKKALFACDEITGLITAVSLVRPSRSLYDLTAKSVKKKWKDRSFAAGANREEMEAAAVEFGVELWQHVDNVILAMRKIAPELGLAGDLAPDGSPLN
jgi:putative nucleotidyltransferase with HDIG domain